VGKISFWISFGISIPVAVAVVVLGGLRSLQQTRSLRDVNALIIIAPYKYEDTWVFDDPAVGLFREPFIAGIDTMIDNAVAKIPNAEKGFRAIFSAQQFPGSDFKLEWRREESGATGITVISSKWRAGFVLRF